MSLLNVVPEIVTVAAGNLQNIGAAVENASAAAAAQTTTIAAPAADEVSAAIAALFGTHAQEFQALSAEATAFHARFVNLLSGGAAQYVSAEAANAQQTLVNTVNAPAEALLGQPLIGTGQSNAGAAVPIFGGPGWNILMGAPNSLPDLPSPLSTTTTSETSSYGTNGTQTIVTIRTGLNLGQVGNDIASYLGNTAISPYLAGKPFETAIGTLGSDASGNTITSYSVTTAGGYGVGMIADTANSNYGENISVPGFKQSATANFGANVYSGSLYIADTGGAVVANTQEGIYTVGAGVGLEAGGVSAGSVGAALQVNTGTGDWSTALSASGPGDVKTSVLVNPGYGIYNATTSSPLGLDSSLNWQPGGTIVPGGTYTGNYDPSVYIDGLTSAVTNSSLNNLAINIDSLFTDNPITQDVAVNIDSLFGDNTLLSGVTGSLGDPQNLLTALSNLPMQLQTQLSGWNASGVNFVVTSHEVFPYGTDGIGQTETGIFTLTVGPLNAQLGSFQGTSEVDQFGGMAVASATVFGFNETASVYSTPGGSPQFAVSGGVPGVTALLQDFAAYFH